MPEKCESDVEDMTSEFNCDLKSQPDEESLQASWAPIQEILQQDFSRFPLRMPDFLPLIEVKMKEVSCSLLPVPVTHKKLLVRLLLVAEENKNFFALVKAGRLPLLEMSYFKSIKWPLNRFCEAVFDEITVYRIIGVLSLEHSATIAHQTDGMCISLLLAFRPPLPNIPSSSSDSAQSPSPTESEPGASLKPSSQTPLQPVNKQYIWVHAEDLALKDLIAQKLKSENTVPLMALR